MIINFNRDDLKQNSFLFFKVNSDICMCSSHLTSSEENWVAATVS